MSKKNVQYESFLENVINSLKQSPKELEHAIDTSEQVMKAASEMTKDEMALIREYVKADIQEFAQSYEESKSGPFYLTIANTIWEGLAEISDKTALEWQAVLTDVEHQGIYQCGDMIALGTLVCEKCGHRMSYNHPGPVIACSECGHDTFTRRPLR